MPHAASIQSHVSPQFDPRAVLRDTPRPLEIVDRPRAYEISADLVGVSEEDVMVHISGRMLTIMGGSPEESGGDDEFPPPALHQVVLLPPGMDAARTSIHCARGRLFLSIPRG